MTRSPCTLMTFHRRLKKVSPSLDDEAPDDLEEGEAIFRSFFMSDGDNAAFSRESDEDALCDESEEN
jgi:hypothetical protein